MDKNLNFFEFNDPSTSVQGVIKLEAGSNKPEQIAPPSPPRLSGLDGYRSYCEVDTESVINRLKKTLWPFDRSKFLESKADLYGAFWVPTTLIFLLSVAGSLSTQFSSIGYSFDPYAIVVTAGVIYFFVLSVPGILSLVLLREYEITFFELLSLYGYSYFIFLPATAVSILKLSYLRWGAFGVASVWAGTLLSRNYYSQIQDLEGLKKYVTVGISFSGYFVLTVVANVYLFK
jgi:protein YIPF1/2